MYGKDDTELRGYARLQYFPFDCPECGASNAVYRNDFGLFTTCTRCKAWVQAVPRLPKWIGLCVILMAILCPALSLLFVWAAIEEEAPGLLIVSLLMLGILALIVFYQWRTNSKMRMIRESILKKDATLPFGCLCGFNGRLIWMGMSSFRCPRCEETYDVSGREKEPLKRLSVSGGGHAPTIIEECPECGVQMSLYGVFDATGDLEGQYYYIGECRSCAHKERR